MSKTPLSTDEAPVQPSLPARVPRPRTAPQTSSEPRSIKKRRLKLIISAMAMVPLLILLVLLSHLVLGRASRATAEQALHETPLLGQDAPFRARWLPDEWHGPRALDPTGRKRIEAAYVRAWDAIGRYEQTGLTDGLARAFAPQPRAQVLSSTSTGARQTWLVSANLRLTFFALDAATVAINDENATVVNVATAADGTETVQVSQRSYSVVLALDDGYWRIHQLRETSSTDAAPTVQAAATAWEDSLAKPTTAVTVWGASARQRRPVSALGSGVDVSVAPGQPQKLDTALENAKTHGAQRVRLHSAGLTPVQLGAALDQVANHQLRATVVLAEAGTDRGVSSWTIASVELRRLITEVHGHPALAMWDLFDGPETAPSSPAQTVTWLLRADDIIRAYDPETPITVSWANPANALIPDLADRVDVLTLPWPADGRRLPMWVAAATGQIGSPDAVLVRHVPGDLNGRLPGKGSASARRHLAQDVAAATNLARVALDVADPQDLSPS